jgi:3-deoxy-D-manno-octulosonic-acid transferase
MGESISLLPIIDWIKAHSIAVSILVTTGTVSSALLMSKRLSSDDIHQYIPIDRLCWVRRFLDHWKPDLAFWTESELWPNLILETRNRLIPMILLNGRMSEKSFLRWQNHPQMILSLLESFSLCLGQSEEDTIRLKALGAKKVVCHGNLKLVAPELPADDVIVNFLKVKIKDRPRWMASQTHQGEEEMAALIHKKLKKNHPRLITMIAPRHPERCHSIITSLRDHGFQITLFSQREDISENTDILLFDGFGELGIAYRVSEIVFIGKSLMARGGQNPLEPARLLNSILFGSKMDNFKDIAHDMVHQGAATMVDSKDSLLFEIEKRILDKNLVSKEAQISLNFSKTILVILDKIMSEISPFLINHKDSS